MGFDLLQTLGLKAKRPDVGPIVDAPKPPKTLFGTEVGKSLRDLVLGAVRRGEGIGFRPGFTEATTGPIARGARASFQEETLPFLESQASARGVGRSTIAARDIGRAKIGSERDINELIARARTAEEAQRATDLSQIRSILTQLVGGEAAQATTAAGEAARRGGVLVGAEQAQQLADRQSLNQLIGTGFSLAAAPFTDGASLLSLPGIFSKGSSSDLELLSSFLKKSQPTAKEKDVRAFTAPQTERA